MNPDPVEERDVQKLLAMLDDPRVAGKLRKFLKDEIHISERYWKSSRGKIPGGGTESGEATK